MKSAALITAGGSSSRFGSGLNKLFVTINGMPVIMHSIRQFDKNEFISRIFIAAQQNLIPLIKSLCASWKIKKSMSIVNGGFSRQLSVFNMLKETSSDIEAIFVHDAARPMIKSKDVSFLAKALDNSTDGVIPCFPVSDAVKRTSPAGIILESIPRDNLIVVQTPQIFRRTTLLKAYDLAFTDKFQGPDESSLVERIGGKIKAVRLSNPNIKLTYPRDLEILQKLMS